MAEQQIRRSAAQSSDTPAQFSKEGDPGDSEHGDALQAGRLCALPDSPLADALSPKRMRVAMLLPFPLAYQDGVTRFVMGLLGGLDRSQQVDTLLLAPTHLGAARRRPLLQLIVAMQHLVRLIRARPDVVHVHEHPVLLGAALVYRLVSRRPVRVVHTIHIEPVTRRPFWKRAVLGWLMRHCWAVTAVSRDTARRLVDVATPLPKVHVVHGGAQVQIRHREDAAVASFVDALGVTGGPILCQMGLNFPRKVEGVLRLIEGFPSVRRVFPDARLLLVGTGPFQERVAAAAARHGVGEAVVLTGYVPDVSLPLAAADLYCHITLQDACPLSLIEAMHVGKPVVASRMGGIPELIVDGCDGLLVEPEPSAIASAVIDLLENPDRARVLAGNAAMTASRRFTWDYVAAEFCRVYGVPGDKPSIRPPGGA